MREQQDARVGGGKLKRVRRQLELKAQEVEKMVMKS